MVQATEPFFRACHPAGSEERSVAVERGWVFGPRSLSIFSACRSSRQAALLQPGGASLQGHAEHIPSVSSANLFEGQAPSVRRTDIALPSRRTQVAAKLRLDTLSGYVYNRLIIGQADVSARRLPT